jgi:hypothetical protein
VSYVTLRRLSKKYKGTRLPNICSSLPWTEKAPARRGVGASRGKSRQSGSKVRPFPLCREHRAEHFLSGVVAVTGTCSSLPNICSSKPRQAPQTLEPKAHLLRMMNEPVTLCFGGGYAILSFCILPSAFTLGIARPDSGG